MKMVISSLTWDTDMLIQKIERLEQSALRLSEIINKDNTEIKVLKIKVKEYQNAIAKLSEEPKK